MSTVRIDSKSNVDDVSGFRFARFYVARLSTHDAPASPPRARGWHNGKWGWGGWEFGQRTQPILAGIRCSTCLLGPLANLC